MDCRSIAMMDSGVGGTSVLALATRMLPHENFVYFADQQFTPYGEKSPQMILDRVHHVVSMLMKENIKALVLACNTATAVAVEALRSTIDIPVIGMEPAVKPAQALCGDAPIVVLATRATLKLPKYEYLAQSATCQVIGVPCPKLVDLVESNADQHQLETCIEQACQKALPFGILPGAIVLGCTHFWFAKQAVSCVYPSAAIVDGNLGTVEQLRRILQNRDLHTDPTKQGSYVLMSSGSDAQKRVLDTMMQKATAQL